MRLNQSPVSGIDFNWEDTSPVALVPRRSIRGRAPAAKRSPGWQDFLSTSGCPSTSAEPTDFYKLPVGRVIEIGRHVII